MTPFASHWAKLGGGALIAGLAAACSEGNAGSSAGMAADARRRRIWV